jgi:hypothetical protein
VGLVASLAFPSVSAGVDTLRLNGACENIASFFNSALDRAERRQQVVEVSILRSERKLVMRSTEQGFERSLELPEGVTILAIDPEPPGEEPAPARRFVLMPGGGVPRFGVELTNPRGARRTIRIDPITGVAQVEKPQ